MTLKLLLLMFYAVLSAAAFAQPPNELSNTHPAEAKPGASAFYSSEPSFIRVYHSLMRFIPLATLFFYLG